MMAKAFNAIVYDQSKYGQLRQVTYLSNVKNEDKIVLSSGKKKHFKGVLTDKESIKRMKSLKQVPKLEIDLRDLEEKKFLDSQRQKF